MVYIAKDVRDIKEAIAGLLERAAISPHKKDILIKPNLVDAIAPPVTTPVEFVEAIIDCFRERWEGLNIVVAEGTGSAERSTPEVFKHLGYHLMAERKGVELIDLNEEPLTRLSMPYLTRWKEFYLPTVALDYYIVSAPVLKAHTLAGVTLTMKNMMGFVPPSHYRMGGYWKKSAFHTRIDEAIFDLNNYRSPDLTILYAIRGMRDSHLGGAQLSPGIIALGSDPVAIDTYGTVLLGRDPQDIGYITMAHGVLGMSEDITVVES